MGKSKIAFWTVDAETDPFARGRVPEPFIWGAYNGDEYHEFETADQLADFFHDKKTKCYAHNGGKFDYHYMRHRINSDEPIMVISGRLARFRIGECEYRDSLNIFPNTRLKDFGIKQEIDYLLMEKDKRHDPNTWAEIKRYLRQDCVGLWDVIKRYIDDYGISLTQAGASMRNFEKMYGLKAPRQSKVQHDRYKPYYYGGRVQCFKQGVAEEKFTVADINSAYPYAMLCSHPWSTSGEFSTDLPATNKVTQCLISLDAVSRGAFPWRAEGGELYFPDDGQVRTYHVTGWEYKTALELGALDVKEIKLVHYFPLTINFAQYINHHFEAREAARTRGDVAGRTFGKYFMNSLYGKFGANPSKYGEYVIASADSISNWEVKGYAYYKDWDSRYLLERKPTEEELNDMESVKFRYYNVATAASITGYVRAYLFRALHGCTGPIYCDTDSIAAHALPHLNYGNKLGEWKDEGTFDRYAIAGKKLYAFHYADASESYNPKDDTQKAWKVASKGVNFAAMPDAPDIIARIAKGERISFEPEVPTYSITRAQPKFISRTLTRTAKNISIVPAASVAPLQVVA